MLSLNVSVPASKGMAVHIALHRLGLLRCLGWGARRGSARPPSSMDTARVRLLSRPRDCCHTLGSSPTRRQIDRARETRGREIFA